MPLLTKRVNGGHGWWPIGKVTSCHALLAGILVGVVLGMFLSMSLLSWLPASVHGEQGKAKTVTDMLPSIKDENPSRDFEQDLAYEVEPKLVNHLAEPDDPTQEIMTVEKSEESESGLRLNEGSRELTEFERRGGWRLTPSVLDISNHFPRSKIVSEYQPRVVLFEKFLSENEIEHVLEVASSHMSRSKVIGGKEGTENNVRTSYGAWLTDSYRDDTIKNIEERIHDAVGIPLAFGEGIYVLRYERSQKYNPHTDNCARADENIKDSCLGFLKRSGGPQCGEGFGGASCGDRIATFIMYLKSPLMGGETLFPSSRITQSNLNKIGRKTHIGDFSDHCQSSLYFKVQPEPGDAVLFWDYIPRDDIDNHATYPRSGSWEHGNATTEAMNDNSSLHGGCPVIDGEKWIATKWIRSTVFK